MNRGSGDRDWSFIFAAEDAWLRSNHHLYATDGTVGGTPAKAMVASGYAPTEFHHKTMATCPAICTSDPAKRAASIRYAGDHVQPSLYVHALATSHHPAKAGITSPAFGNIWVGSLTRFNTQRSAIGWWQFPGGNGLVATGWWQLVGGSLLVMTTG